MEETTQFWNIPITTLADRNTVELLVIQELLARSYQAYYSSSIVKKQNT